MDIECADMKDVYDDIEIVPQTWFPQGNGNSYYVMVWGWNYSRRLIEIDGLKCFWTCEPNDGSLYVTVRPPDRHTSVAMYLTLLLELPVVDARAVEARSNQQRTKRSSRKRRHTIN
jgi:hypothetical protein